MLLRVILIDFFVCVVLQFSKTCWLLVMLVLAELLLWVWLLLLFLLLLWGCLILLWSWLLMLLWWWIGQRCRRRRGP